LRHLTLFAFCALLAACETTAPIAPQPDLPADDPRQEELLTSECAIFFAAVAKMEAEGQEFSGNPTRGCPEEAIAIAADINPMVSVPSVTPGYPQTLYDRMIARGIPVSVADDIAKSRAFWNLVAQRDTLMLGI